MAGQKIRIKLAAYDHELVDLAASRIVETMKTVSYTHLTLPTIA